MKKHFETTGPINLTVELQQGDITLRAREASTTEVRLIPRGSKAEALVDQFTVEARGNDVVITAPKTREGAFGFGSRTNVDVEVDLPAGSMLRIRTGSGDVTASGWFGAANASTGSGDVRFEDLDSAELRSGSGDINAWAVGGAALAKTGSGDISLESAGGRVELSSGSGDVRLGHAESTVTAKTGSGDLEIGGSSGDIDLMTGTGDVKLGAVSGGRVRARTGTGDVSIAVALGVAAYLDLNTVTGQVAVDLDEAEGPEGAEAHTSLTVHSGSGDIHVSRALARVS